MNLNVTLRDMKLFCKDRYGDCIGCKLKDHCMNITQYAPDCWDDEKSDKEEYFDGCVDKNEFVNLLNEYNETGIYTFAEVVKIMNM